MQAGKNLIGNMLQEVGMSGPYTSEITKQHTSQNFWLKPSKKQENGKTKNYLTENYKKKQKNLVTRGEK